MNNQASRMGESTAQQNSVLKAAFEEWGTKTTVGVFAGMLYGGIRESLGSSGVEEALILKHSSSSNRAEKRLFLKELMEHRVLRISRGTVLGGAKLGLFTALFCGVQNTLAVKRHVHDTLNVVAAGSVTAGAFGLLLPGSLLLRVKTALIGSVLGATLGLPLGYLDSTLKEKYQQLIFAASEEKEGDKNVPTVHDAVGDAIGRLEEMFSRK